MTLYRSLLLATALCTPLPALADLTPETLWQDWQDRASAAGRDLGATVEQGGALGLNGLSLTRPLGDGQLTVTFDRLELAQSGPDVQLALPGGQRVTITSALNGDTVVTVFELGADPITAIASGSVDATAYAIDAPKASASLISLDQNGEPVDADMQFDATALRGTITGLADAGVPLVANLRADALASELAVRDPATGNELRNTASQTDAQVFVELMGAADAPWGLTARLESQQASSVSFQSGPDGSFETESIQQNSRLAVTLGDLRADYTAAVDAITLTLRGAMLPAGPVTLGTQAAHLLVSAPTQPDDTAQTARLSLSVADLVLDDGVWSMFDPGGAFPRTPAQLELVAEVDIDVLGDGVAPVAGTQMPGALPRAIRVETFALDAAGATVSGEGGFTLPEGPGGIPDLAQPVGVFDLRATGITGLIEQAIGAGIVTMEQAMGAQMMIGMFTTPGPGDSLSARVEAREGGALFVNGTQMR